MEINNFRQMSQFCCWKFHKTKPKRQHTKVFKLFKVVNHWLPEIFVDLEKGNSNLNYTIKGKNRLHHINIIWIHNKKYPIYDQNLWQKLIFFDTWVHDKVNIHCLFLCYSKITFSVYIWTIFEFPKSMYKRRFGKKLVNFFQRN